MEARGGPRRANDAVILQNFLLQNLLIQNISFLGLPLSLCLMPFFKSFSFFFIHSYFGLCSFTSATPCLSTSFLCPFHRFCATESEKNCDHPDPIITLSVHPSVGHVFCSNQCAQTSLHCKACNLYACQHHNMHLTRCMLWC